MAKKIQQIWTIPILAVNIYLYISSDDYEYPEGG